MSPVLIDLGSFGASEFFIAVDDYLSKDGVLFDQVRCALQLLTREHGRATASEGIENMVSDLATTIEWSLME